MQILNAIGKLKVLAFTLAILVVPGWSQDDLETRHRAAGFVASWEARLEGSSNLIERFSILCELPAAAFASGDLEKAEKLARNLAKLGEDMKRSMRFDSSMPSFAKHRCNIILGLIEMKRGNVAAAKQYLLAAGQLEGRIHPVLISFGPDMLLAKNLIEKGEQETVSEYLELCAKFWKHDYGKLEDWKTTIADGRIPNFRGVGNLSTVTNVWQYVH